MYKLRIMLVALAVTFVGVASATHLDEASIKQRTMPSGKVYREGDKLPVTKPVVAETSGSRSGEEIYDAKCAMCHGAGIAGAPKVGDAAAWTARIAQGEQVLLDHALVGFQGTDGLMPAKGGCTDCSDEEIKASVKYMLEQSQ